MKKPNLTPGKVIIKPRPPMMEAEEPDVPVPNEESTEEPVEEPAEEPAAEEE